MIRTFISFDTPESVKQEVLRIQNELRKTEAEVSWEGYDKHHVTLKFLGDVDELFMPQLQEIINGIVQQHTVFEVTYGEFGCFPNWNEPRVLWVGCQPTGGTLQHLKRELDSALSRFGFEQEKRKFFPHVTLGRVKGNYHLPDLLQSMENLTFTPQKIKNKEILLMKSVLKREGSEYSTLQKYLLQG